MIAARVVAAAAAFWAAGAAAHAEFIGANPPDGARLAAPPASIELRFNEPVAALSVTLAGGPGAPVVLAVPKGASQTLRVELPRALGEGHYTLSFRVASLDSHPVGGSVAFAVGDAGPAPAPVAQPDELRAWRIAVRVVRDLALLIATGGALFLLLVGRFPGERKLLPAAAAIAAGAALLGVGLQGTGFHSSFAWSAYAAMAGALLISTRRPTLLALGAAAAVASFALTGHSAGRPAALLIAAHALAAAFWAGSLCALLAAPTAAALRRFSRFAMGAVAILIAAGISFAALQLHSPSDLAESGYGRLILGKAALLAVLLALACLNRYRFLPMLERGDPSAAARLRRSIGAELALIAAVVCLTAVLVQTPPPRDAGFRQTLESAGRFAELSVSPARAGYNRIEVRFRDFDPQEVVVSASHANVEPESRAMQREAPGVYTRDGGELVMPGSWTIEIRARIGDFDRILFRAEVPIR